MPERLDVSSRMNPDGSVSGQCDATTHVSSTAHVNALACVRRHATVTGTMADETTATGHAQVHGMLEHTATADGHAIVWGNVSGSALVRGSCKIMPGARVGADAVVEGDAIIPAGAEIGPNAWIMNRRGYAGGQISGETWDAYTVWINGEWRVVMRFACAALQLGCWELEKNVVAHASDISYPHKLYWIEAIEAAVAMAKATVVCPKVAPQRSVEEP